MTAFEGAGLDAAAVKEQALAGQLLVACTAALRVLRIHEDANEAVTKPLESLGKVLESLHSQRGRVSLATVEGVFYLDNTRVRLSGPQVPVAAQLADELKAIGVGGLHFDEPPPVATLITFFRTLEAHRGKDDIAALRRALEVAGVRGAGVSKVLRPVTEADAKRSARDQAADVYVAAIRHLSNVVGTKTSRGGPRSKRIIQELVDLAESEPLTLLALAGLRDTGNPESEHAVAVTALAIALGRRIGLDRTALADLGIAALHHDAGLAALPDGSTADVARHPALAFGALLSFVPTTALFRQVIVGFEHHRDHAEGSRRPHLFSRILRIVNDFDGLTRGRRAAEELDVGEALTRMERLSGRAYDPALLPLFAEVVGGVEAEVPASRASAGPSGTDLLLAEFLGKEVAPPPPPSETDLLLAEFLGKEVAPPPPPSETDLLLAEFLGKEVAAAPKPVVAVRPAVTEGGGKRNAIGALKLKRVPRKRAE